MNKWASAEPDWKQTGIIRPRGLTRFWARVKVSAKEKCWVWIGNKDRDGYGKTHLGGKDVRAHHVAWVIANGPVPVGLNVLHTCDNPSCCNAVHLWLGTNADNVKDKVEKGRALGAHKGVAHHNAKLNDEKVLEMRQLNKSGSKISELARRFGISYTVAKRAIIGQKWKHVPMP